MLLFDFGNFCFLKDADLARKALKPIERVLSSTSEEDEPGVVKFLKMNCRYFTDGKVYGYEICFLFLKSMENLIRFQITEDRLHENILPKFSA